MDKIIEKVQEIFRDVLDDEELVLTDELKADDVEDWDSLAQMNIIVAIEKTFKIKFSVNEIASLRNVGDLLKVIKSRVS